MRFPSRCFVPVLIFTVVLQASMGFANNPPQGADRAFTMSAGQTYTIAVADWGFSDPLVAPPDNFVAVMITTLPSNGVLQVDGVNATNGQIVSLLPGPAGATFCNRR